MTTSKFSIITRALSREICVEETKATGRRRSVSKHGHRRLVPGRGKIPLIAALTFLAGAFAQDLTAQDLESLSEDKCYRSTFATGSGLRLIRWPSSAAWSGENLFILDVSLNRNRIVELAPSGLVVREHHQIVLKDGSAFRLEAPTLLRSSQHDDLLLLLDDRQPALPPQTVLAARHKGLSDDKSTPVPPGGIVFLLRRSDNQLQGVNWITVENSPLEGGGRLLSVLDFAAIDKDALLAIGVSTGSKVGFVVLDESSGTAHPVSGFELFPAADEKFRNVFDYYRNNPSAIASTSRGVAHVLILDPNDNTFYIGRIDITAGYNVEHQQILPEMFSRYELASSGPSQDALEFYSRMEKTQGPLGLYATNSRLFLLGRQTTRAGSSWLMMELNPEDSSVLSKSYLPIDSAHLIVSEGSPFFAFIEQQAVRKISGGLPYISASSFALVPEHWLTRYGGGILHKGSNVQCWKP